jgi:hypothetical protein
MTRPAPPAAWPAQMRAETAAAYLDEVSVDAFLRSVRDGLYPKPVEAPGKGTRWLRDDLDAALDRIHHPQSPARGSLAARV